MNAIGRDLSMITDYFRDAAILGAIDYKLTFAKKHATEEQMLQANSACHTRSAERLLRALLANGGNQLARKQKLVFLTHQ